jgi:hypothetical protein
VTIDNGATFEVGGTVNAGVTINFERTNGTLKIDDQSVFSGRTSEFQQDDIIDLASIAPSRALSATYALAGGGSSAMLSLSDGVSLSIAGPDPVPTFGFTSDGSGGTDVETVPLSTLLNLAFDTYKASPTGYGDYTLLQSANPDQGFSADAYYDPADATAPIIIAFRGTTNAAGPVTFWENVIADLGVPAFDGLLPQYLLGRYVSDAVEFLLETSALNAGVPIILTGHSLGGTLRSCSAKQETFR